MKRILTLLIVTFSFMNMNAQDKLGISLSTLSNANGLNHELSLQYPISNKLKVVARYSNNFRYTQNFNLGLGYNVYSRNRFGLDVGAEYNFGLSNNRKFLQQDNASNYTSHNLEFPLLINYDLSKNFEVFGGSGMKFNFETGSFDILNSVRLGVTYKW